jgi:hypothetical protein
MGGFANTRVNGAITVLREIFDIAVEKKIQTKADRDALLEDFKYAPQGRDYQKELAHLPEPDMLVKLRKRVHKLCKLRGTLGFWLFDFFVVQRVQD